MVKIILIRHFPTPGNLQKKYIGSTDESISEEGAGPFREREYPEADVLFASPMKRCLETAALAYPRLTPRLREDFRECSFGDFENLSYQELSGNGDYQAWVDSGGTMSFPNGEDPAEFRERCVQAFMKAAREGCAEGCSAIAFVVHGGTIMSILDRFSHPRKEYYHWQAPNGTGYTAEFDETEGRLINICSIL